MAKNTIRLEDVPLDKITVGVRRRKDMGDLQNLASSMEHLGLQHPVRLDADYRLVCGGRRLAAARLLGWKTIPATIYHQAISPDTLRSIELAENRQRKSFTEFEEARSLIELAKEAESELRAETLFEGVAHRAPPVSERAVVKRLNEKKDVEVSRRTLQRAKKRVEEVERDPSLMDKSQGAALKAADEREGKPKKSLSVAAESELSEIMRACGRDEMGTIEKVVKDYHKYLFGMTEECFNRIVALRDRHGYKSEQSVLESAVETLYTIVTNNKASKPEPVRVRSSRGIREKGDNKR